MKLARVVPLIIVAAWVVASLAIMGCILYLNPLCTDAVKNGTETDVDCGGVCGPCQLGRGCDVAADCANGNCVGGTCRPLPCENGVKDGAETDVDCGGPTCRKCAGQRSCTLNSDCFSGTCDQGKCSSLQTVEFAGAVSYPAEFKTYVILAADVNKDGLVDLVACNEEGSSVSVYLGRGDGTFNAITPAFKTGEFPTGAVIADFNKDGNLDIATANFHGNSVSVLLGTGDGHFGAFADYPTDANGETQKVAAGDLDHDGNL